MNASLTEEINRDAAELELLEHSHRLPDAKYPRLTAAREAGRPRYAALEEAVAASDLENWLSAAFDEVVDEPAEVDESELEAITDRLNLALDRLRLAGEAAEARAVPLHVDMGRVGVRTITDPATAARARATIADGVYGWQEVSGEERERAFHVNDDGGLPYPSMREMMASLPANFIPQSTMDEAFSYLRPKSRE